MSVYYGTNRRINGMWVIVDCGPHGEQCKNSHIWRLNRSYVIKERVVGYCLNLPGNPANWEITTRAGTVELKQFDRDRLDDPTVVMLVEKEEKMHFD